MAQSENYTLDWVLSHETDSAEINYWPIEAMPAPESWPFMQLGALEVIRNEELEVHFEDGWLGNDETFSDGESYVASTADELAYATDFEDEQDWDCDIENNEEKHEATVDEKIRDVDDVEELEAELRDLRNDQQAGWPTHRFWGLGGSIPLYIPPPSAWEQDMLSSTKQELEIADLEYEMAICQGQYDPDEVVALIGELYELMIAMMHFSWAPGCISYAPHTDPPVNMELARSLGYTDSALYIIERLPYFNRSHSGRIEVSIFPLARPIRYTDDADLRHGRVSSKSECLQPDPWIVPLVIADHDGLCVVLDTRLGVIKTWQNGTGPVQYTPEGRRMQHLSPRFFGDYEARDKHPLTYHRAAQCVPAARYLKTLIDAYKDLKIVPNMEPHHLNNRIDYYTGARLVDDAYRAMIGKRCYRQRMLADLYRSCGWPEGSGSKVSAGTFDRDLFAQMLEEFNARLHDPSWTCPEDAEEINFFRGLTCEPTGLL